MKNSLLFCLLSMLDVLFLVFFLKIENEFNSEIVGYVVRNNYSEVRRWITSGGNINQIEQVKETKREFFYST